MSSIQPRIRVLSAIAALATLALLASCQGFFPHNQITSIVLQPTTITVPLGGTAQLNAYGVEANNPQGVNINTQVTWQSTSGAITVANGVLTGVTYSATPATITATYQALPAQTAMASICVEGATNFVIDPADAQASQTGTFPSPGGYVATVSASVNGTIQTVDITTAVNWTTSDPSVVTITNGTDPATVSYPTSITANQVVTVTANYTCNGVTYTPTPTTQLTVTP